MFGRTIRVNIAAPQRIKEGCTRAVWTEDSWLQKHAGETLNVEKDTEDTSQKMETDEVRLFILKKFVDFLYFCNCNFVFK